MSNRVLYGLIRSYTLEKYAEDKLKDLVRFFPPGLLKVDIYTDASIHKIRF